MYLKSKLATSKSAYKARLQSTGGTPPSDYSLSYRSPLISPGWSDEDEEEEEVDDVTELRQLRNGYPLVSRRSPKEKVSNVVQSVGDRMNMKIGTSSKKLLPTLPTLKKKHRGGKAGNYHTAMYHSDYSVDVDDDFESRDDDSEYLLRDVYEQSPSELDDAEGGRAVENGEDGDTRCAQTDEYELSETTQQFYNVLKYKQLQMKDMEEDRGCLEVVDFGGFEDEEESNDSCGEKSVQEVNKVYKRETSSSSDKENSTQVEHTENTLNVEGEEEKDNTQLFKKELSDSLVGLKLADSDNTATQRGSLGRHDTANSSFFQYSTDGNTPEEEVSDAIDLDSHLTWEEKVLGVPKLSPVAEVDTPVESSVAAMTKESSSSYDQQSHVTYTSYLPSNSTSNKSRVMITPTSNGDVIVMTPMEDIHDAGSQQTQDVENEDKNKLMIPSLGKDGEDDERKVDATQIESIYTRRSFDNIRSRAYSNEASPTGVDDLLPECPEGAFTKIHKREDSDAFIPSEGWDDDEDSVTTNNSTGRHQPFGSFERYDDALQDIFKGKVQAEVIQLRPSLESDCGQSSSVVSVTSSSAMQTSNVDDDQLLKVVKEEQDVTSSLQHQNLLDVAVDEDGEQSKGSSKETCISSLGSFSQIYTRTRDLLNEAEEEEEDDSESEGGDSPGDYFDTGYARAASSNDSGETPDFIKELDQQRRDSKMMTRSNSSSRPWAKLDDSFDSGCEHCESDLISAPSQSMTSNGSQEEEEEKGGEHLASSPSDFASPPTVPHIYSGGEVEGGTLLVEGGSSRSTNDSMKDFDNLNNYWVREWSAMAAVKNNTSFKSIETVDSIKELANPDSGQQPRFLLRKDVGDSMDDDDDDYDDDEDANTATNKQNGKDQQATTGKIPAESNICTDCDGNQYLKIYDLDSGRDIYEVIEHGHSLETVEEGEEEDDEEEASVKEKSEEELETIVGNVSKAMDRSIVGPHHKQQQSITSLEDLHSLFDEYQAKLSSPASPVEIEHDAHSTATPQTTTQPAPSKSNNLQFRRVKSSKKRHVHVKKRAIVKAQKNRTKYDLAYLENGYSRDENKVSHRRKMSKDSIELVRVQSQDSHPKSAASASLVNDTNNVFKALDSFLERESRNASNVEHTPKEFEDEDESSVESVTPKDFEQFLSSYETTMEKSPMPQDKDHVLNESSTTKANENQLCVPTLEETSAGCKNEESSDNSSAPSSISIDTFASETKEEGDEEEDVVRDLPAIDGNKDDNTSSQHGEMKRGQSFILAKLYDENLELIESLAAAQSELEKANRKLAEVTNERDELIATSTGEI